MKFLKTDLPKRIDVNLSRAIKTDNVSGFMTFGAKNDYPEIIERLIINSQTASAAVRVFASFIGGSGFESEIGKIKVGRDIRGKQYDLDTLKNWIAKSLAWNNGVYNHVNMNAKGQTGDVSILPFKECRFSKKDDNGYCAKVLRCSDFDNKKSSKTWFPIFNPSAVEKNMEDSAKRKETFRGQVYHSFIDDSYLYPLSPFDCVYLDMDTEHQIQIFKNNEIRNGFTDKIIMNISDSVSDDERDEKIEEIKKFQGANGSKLIVFETQFDENGELLKKGSFQVEKISNNIDDKLFENWEVSLANSIRKAAQNMPAILIDYQQGTLSAASGEAISEAFNVYNVYTKSYRDKLEEIIQDLFENNEKFKGIINWKIKPVQL